MRTEHDFLGDMQIPDDAYWGVFTKRALTNFNLTGQKAKPVFIHSLGYIKLSAAQTNFELNQLSPDKAKAITQASRELSQGKFDSQFPLDAIQAGAGTPFNMNANEVIANRALEILGRKKGDYEFIHPNNHVNMAQSSNDVIPTAIRISVLLSHPALDKELSLFQSSLEKKSVQLKNIIQVGRTHLQDAVPITLGQVFEAYAISVSHDRNEFSHSLSRLSELGIGGTAVGTGINTHPKFRERVVSHLSENVGIKFTTASSPVELTSNMNAFLTYSSALSQSATTLHRISNDLKLLSSGPRAGIGELRLPEVEPGSSIMPGKINPSIPEAAEMACLQIFSHVQAVEMGCRGGQLQLNMLTPLIAYNILSAQELLTHTLKMMREFCIDGISADEKLISSHLDSSLMVGTALAPKLGYTVVSELIKEADKRGISIREIILEKKLLSKNELDELLDAKKLVKPNKE